MTEGRGRPAPRQRGWVEVRWRQFRHAPRPVVRAVMSSLVVAVVLGIGYLAYDVALSTGRSVPGGDLRVGAVTAYSAVVLLSGTIVTWLIVPQQGATRSGWSAALGFFAAVPIAYLVLVVESQVLKPLFIG